MAVAKSAAATRSITRQRAATVEKVLTAAAASGDLQTAIRQHGKGLSKADAAVLGKLTAAELKAIGGLREKLAPLGAAAGDNNGGVF